MLRASQGTRRQGADSVSVRLGALAHPPQVQLDGFKSRALRSGGAEPQTQRHLYATQWKALTKEEEKVASFSWRALEAGGALILILAIGDHELFEDCCGCWPMGVSECCSGS